jgi:hypothetical protein
MSYYNSQYIPMENNNIESIYDSVTSQFIFDFAIYMTIGLIYAILMSLVVDQLLEVELVDKACDFDNNNEQESVRPQLPVNQATDNFVTKYKTCKIVRDKFASKKFIYISILGVISVFAGGYLAVSDPKYHIVGSGVVLGGLWAMAYYTIYNWYNIDRYTQLAIIGLLFAAFVVMGVHRM